MPTPLSEQNFMPRDDEDEIAARTCATSDTVQIFNRYCVIKTPGEGGREGSLHTDSTLPSEKKPLSYSKYLSLLKSRKIIPKFASVELVTCLDDIFDCLLTSRVKIHYYSFPPHIASSRTIFGIFDLDGQDYSIPDSKNSMSLQHTF